MGRGDSKRNRKKSFINRQTGNDIKKRKLEDADQPSHDANSIPISDRNFVGLCKQTAINDEKNLQTCNELVVKGLDIVIFSSVIKMYKISYFYIPYAL